MLPSVPTRWCGEPDGLAFALDLPLLGVPTLDSTAYPHGRDGRPVRAVIAAGRGRYGSALYRWHEGGPHRLSEYANTTFEELAALIVAPTMVAPEQVETGIATERCVQFFGSLGRTPRLGAKFSAPDWRLAWAWCRRKS